MTSWSDHLMILPIVLPLLVGAGLLLINERQHALRSALNLASILVTAATAFALLRTANTLPAEGGVTIGVYRLGDWPAPFAIVLVVDRLAALMLLLTSLLAFAAALYATARWDRAGPYFHSLFQFLLMGVNGAFLTGDLFNLFVFFELSLAASYGLVLYGSGVARVRAGLRYIAVNLAASLLFLIGVSLIYGVTGTLNMADLSQRIPEIAGHDRALLEAGAAVLGIAFLVKAGVWPLSFWLPATYSVVAPPVAAMFAIMSKVGVYAVLRMFLLFFGAQSGASALFGSDLLLVAGVATATFGAIGVLASQNMARLASYAVLVSSGTVLAVIAVGSTVVTGSALFYLVSSTLAIAAFFMLIELLERGRDPGADVFAVTREAYGEEEDEEDEFRAADEVGLAIPATMAILGICFIACALVLAGLPPVSGFVSKFAILSALFEQAKSATVIPTAVWVLLVLLIGSGLITLIAMTRAGVRTLWMPTEREVPRVRVIEIAPVAALLLGCAALTVWAEPAMNYMQKAASSLHTRSDYVGRVLAPSETNANRGSGL